VFQVLWEYRVGQDRRKDFERRYGPRGDWARLFRRARGFCGTALLRDPRRRGRYLTIDWWETRGAYERFRQRFRNEYAALDERCVALTLRERRVGARDTG
jgi:heme-degrading monooxygenase HmoA